MAMASDLLYYASGQQFPNVCREIVQPCRRDDCSCFPGSTFYGSSFSGSSLSQSGFGSLGQQRFDQLPCGCNHFLQVELGFHPISSIIEVRDCSSSNPAYPGSCILPSDLYHIDNFHYLVRDPNPDGTNPGWPRCSTMSPDQNDPGLFQVEFAYGQPVPRAGVRAAATLACEIYMGCNPGAFEDAECRLPKNIVSLTRQGVSMVLQSAFFNPMPGRPIQFGISEIDMFLSIYARHGNTAPSVLLSPDEPDVARRVNT